MKADKEWKNKSGVYKITFEDKCYIGSAVELYGRLTVHISHLRFNKHHSRYMQRVFNKYGEEKFEITILEYTSCIISDLRKKELYYIKNNNSVFNSITPVEYEHTEETKQRISNTLKKLYKEGLNNPKLNKGKKVNIYSIFGETIKENINMQDCANFLRLANYSPIDNALRKTKGFYIPKCRKYLIMLTTKSFNDYMEFIEMNYTFKNIPLFELSNKGVFKCTVSQKNKVMHKVINSLNFVYYSNHSKKYYTFIGLLFKCRAIE